MSQSSAPQSTSLSPRAKKPSSSLARLLTYRLVIPIKRHRRNPIEAARGVAMGMIIGMTPTIGAQMYLLAMIWWLARVVFKWRFSLIIAIAWSWLSNPLTLAPLYFVYYLTGYGIANLFGWLEPGVNQIAFDQFAEGINAIIDAPAGNAYEQTMGFLSYLWNTMGSHIFIGCLPYALGLSWAGYQAVMFMARRKNRKERAANQANQ
ncbi:DUF2062 domain-containing protein [Magnetococcales bacterium HHB-1]